MSVQSQFLGAGLSATPVERWLGGGITSIAYEIATFESFAQPD